MTEEIKYYLDDNGGLWKSEGSNHYYFSRIRLEWIKSAIFFILPSWDYECSITDEDAKKILTDYTANGKWEEEETPLRYFSNDNDDVFAEDIYGNEFYVLADESLMPATKGTIDCMWDGLSEKEAEDFCKKIYQRDEWIMLAKGERLERFIGDYKGIIWLGDYQGGLPKSEIGYRSEVILDDGMSDPAAVDFFEAASIEELKKMTEFRMNRGSLITE